MLFRSTGLYPAPSFPYIPGDEAAGEVIGIGEKVRGFKIGDRVAYVSNFGSYAEERLIDAKFLVKLPKYISYEMGAAMMLKGLTAQYLLRRTFKVKAGDTILVHAAAGGVGRVRPSSARRASGEDMGIRANTWARGPCGASYDRTGRPPRSWRHRPTWGRAGKTTGRGAGRRR